MAWCGPRTAPGQGRRTEVQAAQVLASAGLQHGRERNPCGRSPRGLRVIYSVTIKHRLFGTMSVSCCG